MYKVCKLHIVIDVHVVQCTLYREPGKETGLKDRSNRLAVYACLL